MNQKTSKVEKEFYLRCSYLTLSVLFDKEPIFIPFAKQQRKLKNYFSTAVPVTNSTAFFILMSCSSISSVKTRLICSSGI